MIMVRLQALLLARLRDPQASEKDSQTISDLGCAEMTCFHDDFFRQTWPQTYRRCLKLTGGCIVEPTVLDLDHA